MSGEISRTCTQRFLGPTSGGEGWRSSQAARIDYPLENARSTFEAQYVKLLRDVCLMVYLRPSPPTFICLLSIPFSHPYSLSHPVTPPRGGRWSRPFGRLRGTVGERAFFVQVSVGTRARLFPQMPLNSDPIRSLPFKSVWSAIQPARPYSGRDFPLEDKREPPPHTPTSIPIVVSALPLSAGQAGSDDRPPLAGTRLPKSLFSM